MASKGIAFQQFVKGETVGHITSRRFPGSLDDLGDLTKIFGKDFGNRIHKIDLYAGSKGILDLNQYNMIFNGRKTIYLIDWDFLPLMKLFQKEMD